MKRRIDPNPNSDDCQYEAHFFAQKHGLTLKAAEVILHANGPSRNKCDAAAKTFREAVAARTRQWKRDKS